MVTDKGDHPIKESWVSEGPTQLVKATTGGSTLGMEIDILIPSGGLNTYLFYTL